MFHRWSSSPPLAEPNKQATFGRAVSGFCRWCNARRSACLPAHHLVREFVRGHLVASGLQQKDDASWPLFQSLPSHSKALSGKPLDRSGVLGIVKRRCREADLPGWISNQSVRATGITLYHENGVDSEVAARMAGHTDARTAQRYNRTNEASPAPISTASTSDCTAERHAWTTPAGGYAGPAGITRALYRAERASDVPLPETRCAKLAEIGKQYRLALKLAKGSRAAWGWGEKASAAPGEFVAGSELGFDGQRNCCEPQTTSSTTPACRQ